MSSSTKKRAHFHPYAFAEGRLECQIQTVTLDDGTLLYPEEDKRSISLHTNWQKAKLTIEYRIPAEVLQRVLPADEDKPPKAKLIMSCRCPSTHTLLTKRIDLSLNPEIPSSYDLQLSHDDVAKTCQICLDLVRSENCDSAGSGYAQKRGMGLATAHPWTLELTPPAKQQGRYLDIQFISFAESPQVPDELRSCVFFLDERSPQLLLNTDHPGLYAALNSRGTRGTKARTRDLALDLVQERVWPALIMRVLRDRLDFDEFTHPWQSGVVQQWLPKLFPEENSATTRLTRALDILKDEPFELMTRIERFFQARAGLGGRIEALLKEIS